MKGCEFMTTEIILSILTVLFIPILLGSICLFFYILTEQEHRHELEFEKARQGIFETKTSYFKKYSIHILVILIISIIIVFVCYIFNVPTGLTKYILELVK